VLVTQAYAHHGAGRYDPRKHVELAGRLTRLERFPLNPPTLELTRDIVAEDPEYFSDKYVDSDSVLPADAPFRVEACKELAPEYQPTGRK
jgi:hypothetical protein